MGGVCGARMGLCNGGSYSAREEERGGMVVVGFTLRQPGKWYNSREDHRWEMAWVLWHVRG